MAARATVAGVTTLSSACQQARMATALARARAMASSISQTTALSACSHSRRRYRLYRQRCRHRRRRRQYCRRHPPSPASHARVRTARLWRSVSVAPWAGVGGARNPSAACPRMSPARAHATARASTGSSYQQTASHRLHRLHRCWYHHHQSYRVSQISTRWICSSAVRSRLAASQSSSLCLDGTSAPPEASRTGCSRMVTGARMLRRR